MQAALAVHHLTHSSGTGDQVVHALRGVDLELAPGTFTAVMGPSGSGKSTLLNCVAGLEQPTTGAVVIDCQEITDWSETRRTKFRRERLGFVFQQFHLIGYLTAAQNVGLPLRLAGIRPKRRYVADLLARVGLADRAGHLPSELSGGQQQRVAVARAMAPAPALLLADEPTGALDTVGARGVLELLRSTVDADGQTILMVTHDPVAASYADRVVFLVDGQVAGTLDSPTAEQVAHRMAHLDELVAHRTAVPA